MYYCVTHAAWERNERDVNLAAILCSIDARFSAGCKLGLYRRVIGKPSSAVTARAALY